MKRFHKPLFSWLYIWKPCCEFWRGTLLTCLLSKLYVIPFPNDVIKSCVGCAIGFIAPLNTWPFPLAMAGLGWNLRPSTWLLSNEGLPWNDCWRPICCSVLGTFRKPAASLVTSWCWLLWVRRSWWWWGVIEEVMGYGRVCCLWI